MINGLTPYRIRGSIWYQGESNRADGMLYVLGDAQEEAVLSAAGVELEIVETDPGVRGDTAQGGVKPAKLSTGAVVRVPLFVQIGEKIKVDTRTGEYVSRA